MFFWNSLIFLMIQQMLAIWTLVPLPFLNPASTSRSSQFTYCWSLAWRILSINLLMCEMGALVQKFEHSLALPFFGIGMKTCCPYWAFVCNFYTFTIFNMVNLFTSAGCDSHTAKWFTLFWLLSHGDFRFGHKTCFSQWVIAKLTQFDKCDMTMNGKSTCPLVCNFLHLCNSAFTWIPA